MKLSAFSCSAAVLLMLCSTSLQAQQQNPDIKFIAETLVVQADGIYEADPDLATLTFDISAQDKELRQPTTAHRNRCKKS